MFTDDGVKFLLGSTRSLRDQVASHEVYGFLKTPAEIRVFMENHVFAVWDFMVLLKSLQNALTSTRVLWLPQGDPLSRRLINEIVLDEESDADGRGAYLSHFELYLEAMEECGAEKVPIQKFMKEIQKGEPVGKALRNAGVPDPARDFVEATWSIAESRSHHRIAAAFAIGREEIIPEVFQIVVENIQERFPGRMVRFAYYLERHVNIDKERHWPLAMRMIRVLCGDDDSRWHQAAEAARQALSARVALWDGIKQQISHLEAGLRAV